MKLIEVPIELASRAEYEQSESTGIQPQWEQSKGTINVEHIARFWPFNDNTEVIMPDGDSFVVNLTYEQFRLLL